MRRSIHTAYMYGLQLVTPPTSEPVATATLKAHLRLNTGDEDSLLHGYIQAARELFESLTDRSCLTTTWRMSLDAFPKVIRLPKAPLQSVTSVQYYDPSDTLVTWDSTKYSVDTAREPGRIVPNVWFPDWRIFPVYPPLSYKRSPKITVEFIAGWTHSTIPALVRQGIMLAASHFYQRRESHIEAKLEAMPMGFQSVVNQYRSGWVGNMNEPLWNGSWGGE